MINELLTVIDAKERKRELEQTIGVLLTEFTKATGFEVESLHVRAEKVQAQQAKTATVVAYSVEANTQL